MNTVSAFLAFVALIITTCGSVVSSQKTWYLLISAQDTVRVPGGSNLKIMCETTDNRTVDFFWYKDAVHINGSTDDGLIQLLKQEPGLRFSKLGPRHIGSYECQTAEHSNSGYFVIALEEEFGTLLSEQVVTLVTVKQETETSVRLAWHLLGKPPLIEGYRISSRPEDADIWEAEEVEVKGGSETSTTISGLESGRVYVFSVTPYKDEYTGMRSNEVKLWMRPETQDVVHNVTVSIPKVDGWNENAGAITISWDEPFNTRNLTYYKVTIIDLSDPAASEPSSYTIPAQETTFTFENLSPTADYEITIYAVYNNGTLVSKSHSTIKVTPATYGVSMSTQNKSSTEAIADVQESTTASMTSAFTGSPLLIPHTPDPNSPSPDDMFKESATGKTSDDMEKVREAFKPLATASAASSSELLLGLIIGALLLGILLAFTVLVMLRWKHQRFRRTLQPQPQPTNTADPVNDEQEQMITAA